MDKDITIWQVYHDKSVEETLKEGVLPYYKSFYTKADLEGYSINNMQKFFNEFVCQYYVYKNNIKSDIVGFCQYGKYFSQPIDEIDYENNICAIGWYDIKSRLEYENKNNFLFNSLYKYIMVKYPYLLDKFNNFDWDFRSIRFEVFACKWEDFCKYMEFILGYFKFVKMPIEDINLDNIEENIDTYYIEFYDNNDHYWYSVRHRRIAFYIEILNSIYWSLMGKNIIYI